MRILLIAALLLGVMALPVSASHDSRWTWHKDTITLIDRTHGLNDYVAIKVAEYNALDAGFKIKYERGAPDKGCRDTPKRDGKIVVCNRAEVVCAGDVAPRGCTDLWLKRTNDGERKITAAKVILEAASWSTPGGWGDIYGCHEIGHALGLNHDYGSPDTCMGQERDTPGPHDADMLRKMYR